ncbi:MAG: molybdopterin-guanine dinucleotide biosynthesis protein B [Pseudomonadota bacterium]
MSKRPPVFGITGWKNSGKTTLTTSLIAEFARRGYAVSSIKHAHHAFDLDTEGTDSYRHRASGSSEVAIVGSQRWAIMHELRDEAEPALEDIIARLSPCDLVLIEGYKREPIPKIECRRSAAWKDWPLPDDTDSIVALATDGEVSFEDAGGRPVFDLDHVSAMADFIEDHLGLGGAKTAVREEAAPLP